MIRYYNGTYGGSLGNQAGMESAAGMLAGSPSFDINKRSGALGGRSGEQLKRLYEGGTQQNEQLNEELRQRGIMPRSGPQLPLAFGETPSMGNEGLFGGPQYGQEASLNNFGGINGMELAQAKPASFNFLNPLSWFQGQPQEAIRRAEQGIAPAKGSGSMTENLLRRKAMEAQIMKGLR
jgi:hypothetical protein